MEELKKNAQNENVEKANPEETIGLKNLDNVLRVMFLGEWK